MPLDNQYHVLKGEAAVFPGHCITLAYLIMQAYPSLDAARIRKDGATCPDALSNGNIPGAGGPVYSALDVLKHAFEHGVESAFAYGDEAWGRETASSYRDRREPGQLQADSIKDHFRELFQAWPQKEAMTA
jgi:hypothetical protein